MLFADLPLQHSRRSLAKSFTGGTPVAPSKRAPRSLPRPDAGEAFQGPIDTRVGLHKGAHVTTRLVAGVAGDADYLTRKSGRAIGMVEGWREIAGTPDRARVGLVQIAVSEWTGKK